MDAPEQAMTGGAVGALVMIVVAAAAAGLAMLLIRRSRRAAERGPAGRTLAPIEVTTVEDLPVFNVIALGGQESGKTVLLASMFHTMTTEIDDGVFRLDTDLNQATHLSGLYAKLRDPDADWPAGTSLGETRSFTFTCIGSAGGREFPIFRFNYLDYAGELVGGAPASQAALAQRETQQIDLAARIGAAHALFGIIDGQRMLAYLRGEPDGALYLETSIVPMIAELRRAQCPLHLILTKWDLFDEVRSPRTGETLAENERSPWSATS